MEEKGILGGCTIFKVDKRCRLSYSCKDRENLLGGISWRTVYARETIRTYRTKLESGEVELINEYLLTLS